MNRTGLFIALNLAFVVGLLFGIYPELDLKLAALFYDPATKSFPLKQNTLAALARDGAMWIAWGFAVPAIVALVAKLVRPDRRLLISGRAMIFLLMTLFLSAGVLTNFTFKSYWGRPRPVVVTQFNGTEPFMPWWDPRGNCDRNCSFFSGEGATAFWTYAPAALTTTRSDFFWLRVVGRLKRGVTLEQASSQLSAMSPGLVEVTMPSGYSTTLLNIYKNFRLAAYPGGRGISRLRQPARCAAARCRQRAAQVRHRGPAYRCARARRGCRAGRAPRVRQWSRH